ncbi:MAG: 23S rRNA (guanosine(2251)-2'-O)-methyltransferase RlmB [Rickettsiales bacterium]|nr:MAG: 23S rRNA (guanosine(2251)-2'-O)-methyltransferase RlmB [Rickettsiales bacterium]
MVSKNKINTFNKTQYYIYGMHAVIAAAHNKNRNVKKIFCLSKQEHILKQNIKNYQIEVVDNNFITQKIGKDQLHQGVIALVDSIFKKNIEDLKFSSSKDRIVILDQICDPQNIGAIIRSAAAFGIDKIIMPKDNSPDENATIAKTACGSLELVQIAKVTNLQQSIKYLKDNGFWIIGLDAKGNQNIDQIINIDKIAIIIGSEGKGMRKLTSQSCDFLVNIPISSKVESLNASNAASIIFYLFKI